MKYKHNKKYIKIVLSLVVISGIIYGSFICLSEKIHKEYYNHYIYYGSHTDVVEYEPDENIGLKHSLFSVVLTNNNVFPMRLNGHKIKRNFEGRENGILVLPYKVDKWDQGRNQWLEVLSVDLAKTEALEMKTIFLSPGLSICVVDFDNPTFSKLLQKNDIIHYRIIFDNSFGVEQELITSSAVIQ